MKKLLLALTAAASCALVAKADDPSPILNQTGFENYVGVFDPAKDDVGGDTPSYWTWTGSTPTECAITNYAANTQYNYTNHGAPLVENGPGNSYLSVDASDGQLMRNVAASANPVAIDSGIYFDSLIEFTATDTAPAISNADKLVVWLYGSDETDGTLFGATTGLVVTAGFVSGEATVVSNYFVGGAIEPGSWHRLTIKSISTIVGYTSKALAGFVVYVDGTEVSCASAKSEDAFAEIGGLVSAVSDLNTAGKLFPSLLQPGDGAASTLTSVAFAGTGAIDDLTFTTANPFEVAAETFTLTVTAENGTLGLYSDYACSDPLGESSPYAIPLTVTKAYAMFTPAGGFNVTGATLNGVTVPGDFDSGAYYYELDFTGAQVSDNFAFVITTSGSEPQPPATNTVTVAFGDHVTSVSYCILPDMETTNTLNAAGSFGIAAGDSFVFVGVTFESNDYELDLTNTVASLQGATVNPTTFVITPNGAASGTIYAKQKQAPQPTDWPTGEDLNNLADVAVSTVYTGVPVALANADAKAFVTWASGVGGVAYGSEGSANVDCFLMNIPNSTTGEELAASNAVAAAAIKITAITVVNGVPQLTAPETYGNGKVVVEGSQTIATPAWHAKAVGDYFFRTKLVVDEVNND